MLSARKEAGKFSEGVILSKSMEVLFRAVPPSLYLAMAMTEPEEKAERFQLMQQHGISELDAAFRVAEKIDRARGIEPWRWTRWPDRSDTMRMPSFARRHPRIGLLIVVTIAVASWMLLRAPHPATESMPWPPPGPKRRNRPARPGCMAVPMRASRWSGTPTWSVRTAGPTSRAQALDRRPSRGELAVAPPAAVHARAGRDCRARLAECAGETGGHATFWQAVAWLYSNTRGDGQGLPEGLHYPDLTPAMQGCLDSDRPDAVIRAQAVEAAQQGIAATPAPATARPRVRQDPPAARSRRRRCLAVGHRPASPPAARP